MRRFEDPKLAGELARFSEDLAGQRGRVLHLLHLELIQRGAGLWFQEQQAEETLPPWPEGDDRIFSRISFRRLRSSPSADAERLG